MISRICSILIPLSVLAFCVWIASIAEASVIDSFDDSAPAANSNPMPGFKPTLVGSVVVNPAVSSLQTTLGVEDNAALGVDVGVNSRRDAFLSYTTGSGNIDAMMPNGNGTFDIFSGNASGTVQLEYDDEIGFQGIGGANKSLNLDLTGATVLMDILSFNDANGNGETIDLFVEDGNGNSDVITALLTDFGSSGGPPFTVAFSTSDFTNVNVDLGDIDRLLFQFNISQGTDLIVDQILIAVPEPTSIAIWTILGLIGGASAWRLRRRSA